MACLLQNAFGAIQQNAMTTNAPLVVPQINSIGVMSYSNPFVISSSAFYPSGMLVVQPTLGTAGLGDIGFSENGTSIFINDNSKTIVTTGLVSGNGGGLTNLPFVKTFTVLGDITATPQLNPDGSSNIVLNVAIPITPYGVTNALVGATPNQIWQGPNQFTNAGNAFSGNGGGLTNLNPTYPQITNSFTGPLNDFVNTNFTWANVAVSTNVAGAGYFVGCTGLTIYPTNISQNGCTVFAMYTGGGPNAGTNALTFIGLNLPTNSTVNWAPANNYSASALNAPFGCCWSNTATGFVWWYKGTMVASSPYYFNFWSSRPVP